MLIKCRLIFLETEKGKDPPPRRLAPGASDAAPKSGSLLRPPLGGRPLPRRARLPARPRGSFLESLRGGALPSPRRGHRAPPAAFCHQAGQPRRGRAGSGPLPGAARGPRHPPLLACDTERRPAGSWPQARGEGRKNHAGAEARTTLAPVCSPPLTSSESSATSPFVSFLVFGWIFYSRA